MAADAVKPATGFDELVRAGEVADYSELCNVSRAHVTHIMNTLMLAPDIQDQILHFPRVTNGRDPVNLRQLQPVALVPDWRRQHLMWKARVDQD